MPTPKSRDAKRKLRRWEYEIHATKDGQQGVFKSHALTVGTARLARETAVKIRTDLTEAKLPQFEGATLSVTPIGCEVVSHVILGQITDLSNENKVLVRVIRELVTAQLQNEPAADPNVSFEDRVKERVGQAVLAARNAMIAEQQAQAMQAAAALGGEAVLPDATVLAAAAATEDMDAADAASQADDSALDVELDLTDPKVADALQAAVDAVQQRLPSAPAPETAQV